MSGTDLIAGPTRRCAATGRELLPGEAFVAVVTPSDAGYSRADFAEDAWPGPPVGCVAYWRGRVPASAKAKLPTYPEATLVDWFAHLTADPAQANARYVVALLLMRKKRLKFEDALTGPAGESLLVLRDAKTGARHEVIDPKIGADELAAVEAEIGRVLGWNR